MQQVFYIHGGEPYISDEAFLADLKVRELWNPHGEKSKMWHQDLRPQLGENFEFFTPEMPNKQNAKYTEWKIWFERHFEYLADDIILLGWSLGGIFLAKYLSENEMPVKIKATILLAAPYFDGSLEEASGKSCRDFGTDVSLASHLSRQAGEIVLIYSRDDFLVPYEQGLEYKKVLPTAELMTFEDRNHFLIDEFPELIAKIKEIAGK